MKRIVVAWLLLAGVAWADDVPLEVKGKGVRDVKVVSEFPLLVTAPAGAASYVWAVPAGVTYADKDDAIEITAAPDGPLSVSVRYAVIDWDAKKITRKTAAINLVVGSVQPGPPPDPEAVPSAALKKAMQDAYNADPDPDKAAHSDTLAKLLAVIVPSLKKSGAVKTHKDFQDMVHKSASMNLKTETTTGDEALPTVRPAVGAFIQTRLPRTPNDPVDPAYWSAASIAYSQVSQALKGAVK